MDRWLIRACLSLTWIGKLLPCIALLGSVFPAGNVAAKAPEGVDVAVPDALKPWVGWVLHGRKAAHCPPHHDDGNEVVCAFPSALRLDLDDQGGRFAQQWKVMTAGAFPLPGGEEARPEEVRVNGEAGIVTEADGQALVWLTLGTHSVTGGFKWAKRPQALKVPPATGIVQLAVNGKSLPAVPDAEGRLFLAHPDGQKAQEQDALGIQVFRKVEDGIPMTVTTYLDLTVSGSARQVVLRGWELPGFTVQHVDAQLPSNMTADGQLKIQVKAGRWPLRIESRHVAPLAELRRPDPGEGLPEEEVWVFAARDELRQVVVEDVATLDPSQTMLPEEWKGLPAFLMQRESVMRLREKTRGIVDPGPDRLDLKRKLWLDFDGGGYTAADRMSGTINRSWRLDLKAPMHLGRATVDGQDQLITVPPKSAAGPAEPAAESGIELTRGELDLAAVSRLESGPSKIPAVGWNVDVNSLATDLQLPPGWRLIAAVGADSATETWVARWDLMNLFLLAVFCLAMARLQGLPAAAVALAGLVLLIPEPGAPRLLWFAVLPVMALLRLAPQGRWRDFLRLVKLGVGLILGYSAVVFSHQQIRQAIHPVLERPHQPLGSAEGDIDFSADLMPDEQNEEPQPEAAGSMREGDQRSLVKQAPAGMQPKDAPPEEAPAGVSVQHAMPMAANSLSLGSADSADPTGANLAQYDADANVQTGPGLPAWGWTLVQLRWSGPVVHDQGLTLLLIPPLANAFLTFLRVALLVWLLMLVFIDKKGEGSMLDGLRAMISSWRSAASRLPQLAVTLAAGSLLSAFALPRGEASAQIPSPELLEELGRRLTAKPECLPHCAAVQRLAVETSPYQLVMRLEISSASDAVAPLPGNALHWLPSSVIVDGKEAEGLVRDGKGQLWIFLGAGTHQVVMGGRLPDESSVQIDLPLRPFHASAAGDGWQVDGIQDGGAAGHSLTLSRLAREQGAAGPEAGDEAHGVRVPAFLRLERRLSIGLEWLAVMSVTRLAGPGTAVKLRIPLLAGERVTTPEAKVRGGFVEIALGPNEDSYTWQSRLEPADEITLTASADAAWMEWWTLELSPIWHLEATGIPLIQHRGVDMQRRPHWQPWPGETVTLALSRPSAAAGPTLAMDRSELVATPGLRASDLSLSLSLRSSRGGEHAVRLPEGSEFQSLQINGERIFSQPSGRDLSFPLQPGHQDVVIHWRSTDGIRWAYGTPGVDAGLAGTNAATIINMPESRWILWVRGDGIGPAIRFWSKIVVLALASFALAASHLTPLKAVHWFLLGLGLLQEGYAVVFMVFGFFLFAGYRGKHPGLQHNHDAFNARQLLLGAWAVAAGVGFLRALHAGFFGRPSMDIVGNGSNAGRLNWFTDRSVVELPQAVVYSLPMWVYQVLMLAWSLWLAFMLMKWARWLWSAANEGGFWRKVKSASRNRPKGGGMAGATQPAGDDATDGGSKS